MPCRVTVQACAIWSALAFVPVAQATVPLDHCLSDRARQQEFSQLDEVQLKRARPSADAIPAEFHQVLARLARVASLPPPLRKLRLVAVDAGRNAWIHQSGAVVLSAWLWKGPSPLDTPEIAAVLAHELAHLETMDSLVKLCDTVALVSDGRLSFNAATRKMLEAIWAGDRLLAVRMMRQNHLRELRADERGRELLAAAGFPREAMASMLIKVSAGGQGDYTGTHPALDQRLEALGYDFR